MTTKICPQCGKEFEDKHPDKKHCSRQCFLKSRQIEKQCPICKRIFYVPFARKHKKFCSRKCGYESWKKSDIKCITCGKLFHPTYPSQKFCSKECSDKNPKKKTLLSVIHKQCEVCNDNFVTTNDLIRWCSSVCLKEIKQKCYLLKICPVCMQPIINTRRIYCSDKCFSIARLERRICPICGQKFVANKKHCTSTCSNICSNKKRQNQKKTIVKIQHAVCIVCNQAFQYKKYDAFDKVTCSKKCQYQISSEKRKTGKYIYCQNCNKKFYATKSRLAKGTENYFCCVKCYMNYSSSTSCEIKVRNYLSDNNIPFEEQVPLQRFLIDFVLPNKIAIEVQGIYWHADQRIYDRRKANKQQRKVIDRDKRKKKLLTQRGYKLFIIWETDIERNVCLALADVISEYKQLTLF